MAPVQSYHLSLSPKYGSKNMRDGNTTILHGRTLSEVGEVVYAEPRSAALLLVAGDAGDGGQLRIRRRGASLRSEQRRV